MSIISTSTRKSLNLSIINSYTPDRDRMKRLRTSIVNQSFDFELSKKKVAEILQEVENNQLANYENLLVKVSQPDIKDEELLKIVQETSQSIPLLKSNFNGYIEALFNIKWISRSESLIEEFHNFIVDLLAAKNEFLVFVLSNLIGLLVPADEDREHWLMGSPSLEMNSKLAIIHRLLRRLLEVIPMITHPMRRQLKTSFPYYKKPDFVTVGYIHNLLWILDYCPSFKNDILELVIQKILIIDINVTRAEIEETELEDDDMEDQCMFEMENDEGQVPSKPSNQVMKHPVAETLDLCMEKMMDFFWKKLDCGDNLKANLNLLETIMYNFDGVVLPTHNTQHIQFLMFYICSFKEQYSDMFLSYLWRKLTNINIAANLRVAAISYLSSFIARAKYVPLKTVKNYLKELCNWAHQYTQKCDAIKNHILKAHTVFYSICQAIFYIVAFRSRDLTADDKDLMFMQSLHLSSIVASQLNPLRVCLPAIATIFAGVTRTYQLAYCHTILERNARRKLATIYMNNNEMPEECLDTVFPFDPYLLTKSFKRIDPIYMPYQAHEEESHDLQEIEKESRRRKRVESISMSMEDQDDFINCDSHKKLKLGKEEQDLIYSISPGFHM